MSKTYLLLCLSLLVNNFYAIVFTTVSDGNWNNTATWDANGRPGSFFSSTDQVIVNHDVVLNQNITFAGSLTVNASGSLIGLGRSISLNDGATFIADGEVGARNLNLNSSSSATFSNALTVSNNLRVGNNSTLIINNILTVGNTFDNNGGSINNSGIINSEGDFNNNNGTFQNNGSHYVDGDFTQNSGTYINDGLLISNGNLRVNSGGSINGDGILRADNITNFGSITGTNDICGTDDSTPPNTTGNSFGNNTTNCSQPTPLPIELVYFNVKTETDLLYFEWVTATEMNNNYFEVEYSNDGYIYDVILYQKGAGNSSQQIEYNVKIPFFKNDIEGYYRLKQVDFNGEQSYSKIKFLKQKEKPLKAIIYPNPTNGKELYLALGKKNINYLNISVFNSQGKNVRERSWGKEQLSTNNLELLNGISLEKGLYYFAIKTNNINVRKKVIVD